MAYLRGTVLTPPGPPPIYTPWGRVKHIFHGWDGSRWDVTDGRNGVFLMPEGIEGMGMPALDQYTFSSPVVHGFEWEGWRASGRDVHWVIGIFEDSSEAWIAQKTAFWKIFQPGKVMRWEVVLPNGDRFNINVRFKSDDTSVYSRDPVRLGWAIYGITGMCEQPFWEGATQSPIWYPSTDNDFFNAGAAPDFIIASASDIGNALITNPGDVEAFVRWHVKGPFDTASVGIDGMVANLSTTLVNETVIIDTDPRSLTATRNGVDIMASLGAFEFAPVPPGEGITLSLAMDGTGSIQAFFTPLYFRSL